MIVARIHRSTPARVTFAAALGLWCLGFGPGCSNPATPPDAGVETVSMPPVPAPDGLLASGSMPTPDATWLKARAIIGGPAAFFPQSFGGVVASFLALPVTAAGEIDGNVPALLALSAPEKGGATHFVVGLHVKVGERFLDQLAKGDGARYSAALDPATHISVLTPTSGARTQGAIGVLGNYLLFGKSREDLLALGPYVARTLPTLAVAKEDLAVEATDQALAGPMQQRLKDAWQDLKQQAAGTRAPVLFGDRVDELLTVFGDLAGARFSAVFAADGIHARATLRPKPGAGPASKAASELAVGDAKPLLELPAITQVAILGRSSPETRSKMTHTQAAAIGEILGPSLPAADQETLEGIVKAEGEAAGDWFTLGFGLGSTGPEAFVRAPVVDDAKMSKALGDLLAFAGTDAVKAQLKERSLAIKTGKTVIENLPGDVQRLRFGNVAALAKIDSQAPAGPGSKDNARTAKPAAKDKAKAEKPAAAAASAAAASDVLPQLVDSLYLVEKDDVVAAVGLDSKEALRAAIKAKTEGNLGGDPDVAAAIGALGVEVAFAAILDPGRLVAAKVGKPAPPHASLIAISFGKSMKPSPELVGRVDLSTAAIQELIRNRTAF